MRYILLSLVCAAIWGPASVAAERPRYDLTGVWDFYPDVGDADLAAVTTSPSQIRVPGAWQTQGFGAPGGSIPSSVIGSDLSPAEYLRHNLTARCLYVRDVEVPMDWRGQRIFLCVRRVYRYADVTVNNVRIGQHEGFCSPFEFDITDAVEIGQSARIVMGIDNRQREGRDTVGTANYLGNWGGIGGAVYLEARSPVFVQDVFAMPDVRHSRVVLRVTTSGFDDAVDTPALYAARVRLRQGDRVWDETTTRFGMREITAHGDKLFLNGKPLYLSGYGDDATEPMPAPLRDGSIVWGLRLTAWISQTKDLHKVTHWSRLAKHKEQENAAVFHRADVGRFDASVWQSRRRNVAADGEKR